MSRLLNGLTSARRRHRRCSTSTPSSPSPSRISNRSGQAYLEEFEAEAGIAISLRETAWEFGSAPQQTAVWRGSGSPAEFRADDAVALTWQNLVPVSGSQSAGGAPARGHRHAHSILRAG